VGALKLIFSYSAPPHPFRSFKYHSYSKQGERNRDEGGDSGAFLKQQQTVIDGAEDMRWVEGPDLREDEALNRNPAEQAYPIFVFFVTNKTESERSRIEVICSNT